MLALVPGIIAIALFSLPFLQAYNLSRELDKKLSTVFQRPERGNDNASFSLLKLISGLGVKKAPFEKLVYDTKNKLSLDLYKPGLPGQRPCVIVIHGGSWAGGDSQQLPELNSSLSKAGYVVASINYRLAPVFRYPAPIEDVQSCMAYLMMHAGALSIDTNNFVLLGRSAGGQIAMSAGYTFSDPRIKGVISFYGPSDMIWGYQNPTNPLVLNSCKVMEDYLGGSLIQVPNLYRQSSATETVTAQTPPTLLIYGRNDPLVSALHATRLSKKLKGHRIRFFELYLPWATHGFDYTLNGPGGQISTWTVKEFLKSVTH